MRNSRRYFEGLDIPQKRVMLITRLGWLAIYPCIFSPAIQNSTGSEAFQKAVQDAAVEFQESYVPCAKNLGFDLKAGNGGFKMIEPSNTVV